MLLGLQSSISMETISMANQTSPENSVHHHHHRRHFGSSSSDIIVTSLSPSSIDQQGQAASPQLQTTQSQAIERQNSCGKRFLVSRVQYPVEEDKPQRKQSGYGSHCLRINIADQFDQQHRALATTAAALDDSNDEQQRNRQQQQQRRKKYKQQQQEEEEEESTLGEQQQQRQPNQEEFVTFRYTWTVRITERLIGTGESAILNVSPAFCTAYNGVQFTWLLRICEEEILPDISDDQSEEDTSMDSSYFASGGDDDELEMEQQRKKVNITLYYKEGPARDVKLSGGNISIRNSEGILFDNMPLRNLEYTKGGGWSPISDEVLTMSSGGRLMKDEQHKFSEFIHDHIGKQITVRVQMKMPALLFQPMQYLPSIESPQSDKLAALCVTVLDEIRQNQLKVPGIEHFDLKTDKYALYRHVFQFGCSNIFNRFLNGSNNNEPDEKHLMERIQNIFAHFYFNTVIVREAECFEDFLEALDASRHVQFPALRRECERYICTEVMAEFADLAFVKKMLLLAERFNLSVLKMVSFGVIVDRLLVQEAAPKQLKRVRGHKAGFNKHKHGGTIDDSMEEIREELLGIAEQIIHPTDHLHNIQCSSPSSISASSIGGTQMGPNLLNAPRRKHSKSLGSPRHSSHGSSSDSDDENGAADESDAESDAGGETLVGSVITQLEELARHIRKVSMPPGVSPAPTSIAEMPQTPTTNSPGIVSMDSGMGSVVDSRRSSLKTTREFLLHHHLDRTTNIAYCNSPAFPTTGSPYPAVIGNNSFFTQIHHRQLPRTDTSSVCSTSSSSSDCVPRRQSSIRDRVNSSNIENAMRPPSGRDNVQQLRSRPISSSCSKLYAKSGVRFEPVGGRHREVDEDEGVDFEDQ